MGKGDKKTKRGKIVLGTFGARRRRKKNRENKLNVLRQEPVKMENKPEARPVVTPKKKLKTNAHP